MDKKDIIRELGHIVGELAMLQSDVENSRRRGYTVSEIAGITRNVKSLMSRIDNEYID